MESEQFKPTRITPITEKEISDVLPEDDPHLAEIRKVMESVGDMEERLIASDPDMVYDENHIDLTNEYEVLPGERYVAPPVIDYEKLEKEKAEAEYQMYRQQANAIVEELKFSVKIRERALETTDPKLKALLLRRAFNQYQMELHR